MSTLEKLLAKMKRDIQQYLAATAQAAPDDSSVKVPLNVPTFAEDEIVEAIHSLLTRDVTMGQKVAAFESDFAKYMGVKHAIMVNSGSSANLLVMAALTNPLCPAPCRLRPGDEVLVPAVTWSTTLWPVINMGLIPVLVDAELRTLNMSVAEAGKAISPRTKAIFVAHILGNTPDMDGLRALADQHGLILLEDSCEALGTTYRGVLTGGFSVAATYSFYFSHHITTIEGGMVLTADDEVADICRCLRSHGWTRHMHNRHQIEAHYPDLDPGFLFLNVGYNLRPTEIQAAFGLHQLPKLKQFNEQRKRIAAALLAGLQPLQEHLQLIEPTAGTDHTWFGFPVILTERHRSERKAFAQHLGAHGIETRPIVAGNLARQPALRHFPHRVSGDLPNAQIVTERGIYWATHPVMQMSQVEHVIDTVNRYFQR